MTPHLRLLALRDHARSIVAGLAHPLPHAANLELDDIDEQARALLERFERAVEACVLVMGNAA